MRFINTVIRDADDAIRGFDELYYMKPFQAGIHWVKLSVTFSRLLVELPQASFEAQKLAEEAKAEMTVRDVPIGYRSECLRKQHEINEFIFEIKKRQDDCDAFARLYFNREQKG